MCRSVALTPVARQLGAGIVGVFLDRTHGYRTAILYGYCGGFFIVGAFVRAPWSCAIARKERAC